MNKPHLQLADGTFIYLLEVPEGKSSASAVTTAVQDLMRPLNGAELVDVRVVGFVNDRGLQPPHFLVEVRTRVKPTGGVMTL